MTQEVNRQDQIVHRFYLKTVGVLVDGRLTHHGVGVSRNGGKEPRVDKWFNLPLPDPELFRSELALYKTISSTYAIPRSPTSPTSSALSYSSVGAVPPLLIAFTLDTTDVVSAQRHGARAKEVLMWRSPDGRNIRLDLGDPDVKGKGKKGEESCVKGIVLEQWTLRCLSPHESSTSSSTLNSGLHDSVGGGHGPGRRPSEKPTYIPPTSSSAYKSGIIHFRALYQYIRLQPTYQLYRRLKRSSPSGGGGSPSGLKIGIKLWCAEGWGDDDDGGFRRVPKGGISDDASTEVSDEDDEVGLGVRARPGGGGGGGTGLKEAWERMEKGLIGLETPLGNLSASVVDGSGGIDDGQRRPTTTTTTTTTTTLDEEITDYTFPAVPISNGLFHLTCRARSSVDFWVEDAEAALSSKFAAADAHLSAVTGRDVGLDLEEEYFTPTLARRRTDSTSSTARPSSLPSDGSRSKRIAGLSATRPTDLVAQAHRRRSNEDSRGGTSATTSMDAGDGTVSEDTRGSGSKIIGRSNSGDSSTAGLATGSTGSLRRWSNLGEGLPFAIPQRDRAHSFSRPTMDRLRTSSLSGRSSPGGIYMSRRLSSYGSRPNLHDLQEQAASGRLGGGTPPSAGAVRPGTSYEGRPGSSLPRSGSFLSQSGRSFTRMNELPSRPPLTTVQMGSSSGSYRQSTLSPSSGSFQRSVTTSAVAQLPRPPLASHPTSPAQLLPPTFEEEGPGGSHELEGQQHRFTSEGSSPRTAPQLIKRYSASLAQRPVIRTGATPGTVSSGGSSVGERGGPAGTFGSLRRTSTRGSIEGAPGSFGTSNRFLGTSLSRVTSSSPGDGDEINLFLKTLDTMPRPPSIAASTSALRPHLPSTSSSLSATHTTSASSSARAGMAMTPAVSGPASPSAISSGQSSAMMRRPLTKTQVDDTLRRMANSFAGNAGSPFSLPSQSPTDRAPAAPPSSALPATLSRRASAGSAGIRHPASYLANKQATDALSEMMSNGSAGPGMNALHPPLRASPTNRDIASLVSRTSQSSVKSSSPLAGAPILAPPPSGPPSPAGALIPRQETSPALIALPASPGFPISGTVPHAADRELSRKNSEHAVTAAEDATEAVLSTMVRRALRPEDVPLPGETTSSRVSRQPSVDGERERRRPPVLLRGGFSQFNATSPGCSPLDGSGKDRCRETGITVAHSLSGNGELMNHRSHSMTRSPMSMPERDPLLGRANRALDAAVDDSRPRLVHGTSEGRITPSMMPVAFSATRDRPISPSPWLGSSRVTTSATSSPLGGRGVNQPILSDYGGATEDRIAPSSLGSREAYHARAGMADERRFSRWHSSAASPQGIDAAVGDIEVVSPWEDDVHDDEAPRLTETPQRTSMDTEGDAEDSIVGNMEMSESRRVRMRF